MIREIAEKVAEELGEKLIKEIGSGDFGWVFLLESGKVLKLTSDTEEVIIANKLTRNKNLFQYILNYYNVGEIENIETNDGYDDYKYFILMDYIEPINDFEARVINLVYKPLLQYSKSFYKSIFSNQIIDYVVDQFNKKNKRITSFAVKSSIEEMKKFAIRLIPHIQNIAKDLKLHHIEQCDFHGGNLGWNEDHTKLVLFDITKASAPYQRIDPKVKKYTIAERLITKFRLFNN